MNTIIHPITGSKININSEAGRVLLKKYINLYKSGGSYAQRHNLYPRNLQQGRFSRNFPSLSIPGAAQRIYTEIIPALNEATQSVPQEEDTPESLRRRREEIGRRRRITSDTELNTTRVISRDDARERAAERERNADRERRQNNELYNRVRNGRMGDERYEEDEVDEDEELFEELFVGRNHQALLAWSEERREN